MKVSAREDDGASLVIVLVFLLLVSVVALSLLTFSQVSFEAAATVRDVRQVNYAADAGTELAIREVARDKSGDLGTPYGPTCEFTLQNINGLSSRVTCAAFNNAGAHDPRRALNALLTVNSLSVEGTFGLTINGRIYSNGAMTVGSSSNSTLHSEATITSEQGADCPSADVTAAMGKTCSAMPSPAGDTPAWDPLTSTPALPLSPPVPSCKQGKKKDGEEDIVTFSPGKYILSPATIADLIPNCDEDSTLYFRPGAYYFEDVDFALGNHKVVAGEARGTWLSAKKPPPEDGTACLSSSTQATQFILGGASSIHETEPANNPVLTFCAGPPGDNEPPISIYGVPAAVGGLKALTSATALETGNKPLVFVYGSVYLPTSAAALALHNKDRTYYYGGMVVGDLTANLNASSTQTDAPISLAACSASDPCRTNRRVLFTADTGDGDVLRSLVGFDDEGGATPAKSKTLEEWSVLR